MRMKTFSRRQLFQTAATLAATIIVRGSLRAEARVPIAVYKDPSCGCCHNWVEHMNASGFVAKVTDTADVNKIKRGHHMPEALWSCHTALVGGYVIEGHVPAADIRQLLKDRPAIVGLAVPGMPLGSPGMESSDGRTRPFDVLAFDKAGKTTVFASHK